MLSRVDPCLHPNNNQEEEEEDDDDGDVHEEQSHQDSEY